MKKEDINFESLDNIEERNVADNFNLFYIRSIDNIMKSINEIPKYSRGDANANNEDREFLQHFDTISIENIEGIVRRLPRKKGTDEGISIDIMKTAWHVIKSECIDIINSSLNERICPEGWKTSTIKSIPKIEQPKKASQFRPVLICYQHLKKY